MHGNRHWGFCLRPPLRLLPVLRQRGEEAIGTAVSEGQSTAAAGAGEGPSGAARPGESTERCSVKHTTKKKSINARLQNTPHTPKYINSLKGTWAIKRYL